MNARQPDTILVAVTRADGGLTMLRVITAEYEPDEEGGRRKRWEVKLTNRRSSTTRAYIDALIAKYEWTGDLAPVSWRIVPDDFIDDSTDRTFRDAWRDKGNGSPDVDMPAAREIHRRRLRVMRAPLLEELDTDYLRADEDNRPEDKAAIVARKQALRDVTIDPAIEAAQTPDELKAVIPEALG